MVCVGVWADSRSAVILTQAVTWRSSVPTDVPVAKCKDHAAYWQAWQAHPIASSNDMRFACLCMALSPLAMLNMTSWPHADEELTARHLVSPPATSLSVVQLTADYRL
jgi:hypothetical protein